MEGKSGSGRRMSGQQTEAGKPQQAQGATRGSFCRTFLNVSRLARPAVGKVGSTML